MKTSDTIAFGSLIVTIISGLILPFIHVPILEYDLSEYRNSEAGNMSKFFVNIHNYGMASANNVIISFNSGNTPIIQETSTPFLSDYFKVDKNSIETTSSFSEIRILPSFANVTVTINVNSGNAKPPLVYVSSDESIGHSTGYFSTLINATTILISGMIGLLYFSWRRLRLT